MPYRRTIHAYQQRVVDWLLFCFGVEIASDKTERTHRFVEEAIELAQAANCTKSEVLQLVDYVYGRPVGELHQEIGGTIVTLVSLCQAHGQSLEQCADEELMRVWEKVETIRTKHAGKPKFSPLPGPTPALDDWKNDPQNGGPMHSQFLRGAS